jgi:hypothetical protein
VVVVSGKGLSGYRNFNHVCINVVLDIQGRKGESMRISREVQMTRELIQDTLRITQMTLHDATTNNFKPDVFPWAVNAMLQKNLEHTDKLLEAIEEDAVYLEKRMSNTKEPDEYGRDTESGKLPGRYLGLAKE